MKAKYTTGEQYAGNHQYLGNGMSRSCGRCSKHRTTLGGKHIKPYGFVCCECVAKLGMQPAEKEKK